MSSPMDGIASDPVDLIMEVMEVAFDPDFGEAWNRRQVSDALTVGNCRYWLVDEHGGPPEQGTAAGFLLSRPAADEEELLLIAVRPEARGMGLGSILIERFLAEARLSGIARVFLEMREGNPAAELYKRYGFDPVGRRPNYYNRGRITRIDAITFSKIIQ
jgi:ribosomal-protein-alanine N-acetyltransferase